MSTKREGSPSRHWAIRSPADLGRAIAGVRAERELTQEGLAEQVGVDRSYLARLEAGGTTLALERALRALRRMGATVTVTLPDDDGPG
ncbi:MAG TPA: helix-turn-helix transcriptional regulator [Solirubrobacterales bacterium]|jgi:transcriptional regulator with XRE-family HTH domain|nr:helix-turn-helix transcriptional regulator [Solirubrobacterales bacterium]